MHYTQDMENILLIHDNFSEPFGCVEHNPVLISYILTSTFRCFQNFIFLHIIK